MIIRYDKKADAAYVYLTEDLEEKAVKTYPIDPEGGEILVDINKEGKIIGVEILDASKKLHKNILDKSIDISKF